MNTSKTTRILRPLSVAIAWSLAVPALSAATFLIDFGTPANPTGNDGTNQWNNLTANGGGPRSGTVPLVDVTNSGALGLSMNFQYPTNLGDTFGMNSNDAGDSGSLSNLGLLDVGSARRDTLWSNGSGQVPTLTFQGLDANTRYTFSIYAYRNASPARTTFYTLAGAGSATIEYNVLTSIDNGGTLAVLADSPNPSDELVLTVAPGSGGFAYIGALQIDTAPVPEPGRGILLAVSGGLLMLRRRRR